jgi:TolB-like protein/Tfp pilus assembly protein PilF
VNEFLARLRQRKLVQWTLAYVAAAFALIQVIDVASDSYDWPHLVMHLVFGALALGFVVALVLAWYHGERGAQRVSGPELLLIALALAIGGGLLWHFGKAGSLAGPANVATTAQAGASAVAARSPDGAQRNPGNTVPDSAAKAASSGLRGDVAAQPIPAKSIAVLPFVNESGNKEQQYFSDGLSEDLITALSQFAGLKVISRDSAFQFRHSPDSSAGIGHKLGVAHLLEGSVQREGDEVRISATLVNAADGSTLWSDHYDRPYKDLFALQDAITHDVAGALKAQLMTAPGAVVQSDRPPSGNLDAYTAFLQGQGGMVLGDLCDNQVMANFQKAIHLDPRYALAYVRVSQCWVGKYRVWHTAADGPQDIAHARAAIKTALTLDPDLAAAHVGHGFLLYSMDFDWYGAEAEYRRALQLAPDSVEAKAALADVLATLGHLRDAIALRRAVLDVDPKNVKDWLWLSNMLVASGQLDDAERATDKALALDPHIINSYVNLAMIEVLRGNARQAMVFARKEPDPMWRRFGIALAAQIGPDHAKADAALQALIPYDADTAASLIADVYALRRDPDNMFKWLDRAWAQRDVGIEGLLTDNFILRYKNDPRFAALCKKVGLPTVTDAKAMK